jgi:hypothetical protein
MGCLFLSLRTGALLILRAVRSNLDTPAIYSTSHLRSALYAAELPPHRFGFPER